VKNTWLVICLLLGSLWQVSAQSGPAHATPKGIDTAQAIAFFESQGLVIDACDKQPMYLEIYRWLGTPYRFGGESERGIDCSGFSNKIYENIFGKTLQGGSRDIYKAVLEVDLTFAREGDLLFFTIRKGQISHVGIYLGNNKFVHATTRAGVIISDLDEPYYQRTFFAAGRVLP
jgi:lipoprotein Spr